MRPLGPIGRRQGRAAKPGAPTNLFDRMNRGELTPAPVPPTPVGMFAPDRDAASLLPAWVRPWMIRLARLLPRWLIVLGVLAFSAALVAFLAGAVTLTVIFAVVGAIALALALLVRRLSAEWERRIGLQTGAITPEQVRDAAPRPEFVAVEVPLGLGPPGAPPQRPGGQGDAASAAVFQAAAVTMLKRATVPPASGPILEPVDLPALGNTVVAALDPAKTIGASVSGRLKPAPGIMRSEDDALQELMAAPEFAQPMYEPLRDLGQDWLLPGLEKVPQNTMSLLVTNQRFIEAYMVGLSHEMGRELLWNEYPTDQRGTYFRQFWDVSGYVPPPGETLDPELLKDIDRIHEWPRASALGAHTSRRPPPGGEHLVMLVRGELLRRYPNTIVYAAKAKRGATGRALGDEERHPVFRGSLKPDVTFFGFELTADEARGSPSPTAADGWFFVLQEQPSEPRFGLDIAQTYGGQPATWDALSWGDLAPDAAALDAITHIDLTSALPDTTLAVQASADVVWRATAAGGARGSRASDLAYITLQLPVRIAIHGSRMLPSP